MDKETPFFSIVIPTKNRPNYLRDAIRSVLLQDFDDFELIVSDNFNEAPTQEVINEFRDHPKFKSFRTDRELNMINHWEFATKKAKGQYVILLADRKVLYQGALKKAFDPISENPEINAFSFGVRTYDETSKIVLDSEPFSHELELLDSDALIRNFMDANIFSRASFDLKFPKTLNGCYKNEFARSIRDQFGAYFCLPSVTTPDYSSLFINLSQNDHLAYLNTPLIMTQGEAVSNGRNFGKGKIDAYLNSLGMEDVFARVPIKGAIIYNMLCSDLLVVQERCGGKLVNQQMNWVNYYATNQFEINRKTALAELPNETALYFQSAWDEAFEQEDEAIQQKIVALVQEYEQAWIDWNRGPKKSSPMDYVKAVGRKIRKLPPFKSKREETFESILLAAKFSEV